MTEAIYRKIVRGFFAIALLAFALAFLHWEEPAYAGGLVTAALGLIGSVLAEKVKDE